MATETTQHVGKVVQIIGPAVDIEFSGGYLPAIYNAIRVVDNGELGKVPIDVVVEVANHIGENQVRVARLEQSGKNFAAGVFISVANLRYARQRDKKLVGVFQDSVLLGGDGTRSYEGVLFDLSGGQFPMLRRAVENQCESRDHRTKDQQDQSYSEIGERLLEHEHPLSS